MAPIVIYHNEYSPLSSSVVLLAKYLKVDFEVKKIDLLAKEQLQDWYIKLNPQHTVPTLVDNGFVVTESKAILAYLANISPKGSSLYPTDPKKRSVVDSRLYFEATTLFPRGAQLGRPVIYDGKTEFDQKAVDNVLEALGWLNDMLKGKRFVAGDELSIADFAFVCNVLNFYNLNAPMDRFPEIKRWFQQFKSFDGFEEVNQGSKGLAQILKKFLSPSLMNFDSTLARLSSVSDFISNQFYLIRTNKFQLGFDFASSKSYSKMAPITIYHNEMSPLSRSVIFLAKYLKINIEIKRIDLVAKEQLQDWYIKINPQHSVPTLVDNGFILTESKAILGYLINSVPNGASLYSTDKKKRALIDSRLYFDATTLFPRSGVLVRSVMTGATEFDATIKQNILEALGYLNGFLKGNKWVTGSDLTIADFALFSTVAMYFYLNAPMDQYPEIKRWYEQFKSFDGYQDNVQGAQGLANFLKSKVTKGF
uniref:glutathione transferase n=1 Tax=Culicoides sonorensis TaxID=179676 RepID=A0A336LQC1_CULSO